MAESSSTVGLSAAFFDSGARIAGIWPIWGLNDPAPDAFKEAVEYADLPQEVANLIPEEAKAGDDIDWDEVDWGELACAAYNAGLHGYIIAGEHPVLTATGPNSATSSWGYYETRIFYAPTVEAGVQQVIDWANQLFTDATAKFGAAA